MPERRAQGSGAGSAHRRWSAGCPGVAPPRRSGCAGETPPLSSSRSVCVEQRQRVAAERKLRLRARRAPPRTASSAASVGGEVLGRPLVAERDAGACGQQEARDAPGPGVPCPGPSPASLCIALRCAFTSFLRDCHGVRARILVADQLPARDSSGLHEMPPRSDERSIFECQQRSRRQLDPHAVRDAGRSCAVFAHDALATASPRPGTPRPSPQTSSPKPARRRSPHPWVSSACSVPVPSSRSSASQPYSSASAIADHPGQHADQEEAPDDVRLRPAEQLEMMVQRRHLENALARAGALLRPLELAHLQHVRRGLGHEDQADDGQQQPLAGHQRHHGQRRAQRQRARCRP